MQRRATEVRLVVGVLGAVVLGATACTGGSPGQPSAGSPSAVVSVAPRTTASPTPPVPQGLGPDSIAVIDRATAPGLERLTVRAPANTRFLIGTGTPADDAAPCATTTTDSPEGPYRVECPAQGAHQKLFSVTTDGDFDYGFTKDLD